MAEVVLRDRLETAGLDEVVIVDSAGTGGWHVGNDADARARQTLEAAGYDFRHSARQFQPDWLDEADLVLAMDLANLTDLQNLAETYDREVEHIELFRSFDPAAPADAEVPDPHYGGAEGFASVLAMVERAADGVVEHVAAQLSS
jgi:protein-tyrosine phosphatase